MKRILRPVFVLFSLLAASPAHAQLTYTVTFDDPGNTQAAFYDVITSHTLAAGALWDSRIQGPAALQVIVRFPTSIPRATGRSMTTGFVRNNGVYNIFEQGAAYEIRTGADPNGATADIEFQFNPGYLSGELWFDPNPIARTATVPGNRTDAMSVFLHEFGHAFAFNGWRDPFNGSLPGDYMSTWDEFDLFDGENFYFNGPRAMTLYGGPLGVTYGNNSHLGNNAPRPGADLVPDLMNGVVFFRGTRYHISEIDWAIAADVGLAIAAVPEPATWALMAGSAFALVGAFTYRRRLKRREHEAAVDEEVCV
jgi:hypothetical protein